MSTSAHLDGLNRAVRTFVQGLVVDAAGAVVLVASTQLADLHWTQAYWTALGLLLIKTAVSAGVSYVGRRVAPPPAVLAAVPAGGTPSPKTF